MPLMKVSPSTGAFFCLPSHSVQRHCCRSSPPGFGKILTTQGVTVCGRVKGTIRAVRVKLQRSRVTFFHRSLSIDENSQFEGSSRRVENPTDPSPSVDAKDAQKKDKQSPAPAPLPSIDAELTAGPKHRRIPQRRYAFFLEQSLLFPRM